MKNYLKERKIAISISVSILLLLSIGGSILIIPNASAHTPAMAIHSFPYLVVSPNPIGVGQTAAVVCWIDEPLPNAHISNDIRRHDYTVTITKPDGTSEKHHWDVVQDTTSMQYFEFTPDQVGNYTLKFDYGGQTYTWAGDFQNDTLLPASTTTTLTVQQEPIPNPPSGNPLPTEYWTRPIDGENWNWYTIASNWLSSPYIPEGGEAYPQNGFHDVDAMAPNTGHIMWTKPIQLGGIVGGNDTQIPGEAFYTGNSYNPQWTNPIIMEGTMYYQEPQGNTGKGGNYIAVDLRTGKELWRVNTTATGIDLTPSFGYLYSLDDPNQHGVVPNGMLIATAKVAGQGTVWRGYDPRTGQLLPMTITNVPSGDASVAGPSGEYLKISLTNLGTTTNPQYCLTEWNSSKVLIPNSGGGDVVAKTNIAWYTGIANASLPSCYDYNITVALPNDSWSPLYQTWQSNTMTDYGNVMLVGADFVNGNPLDPYGTYYGSEPTRLAAISLKPGSIGQVLWTKTIQQPGNSSYYLTTWDPAGGIFIFRDRHNLDINGYSLASGEKIWGPVSLKDNDFASDFAFLDSSTEVCGYGKVFVAGYEGLVKAFDEKTGNLVWTYGNGGEGNNTFIGGVGPFGREPLFVNLVAGGKIFTSSVEHSPNSPLYGNYYFRALNATDGTELWKLDDYGTLMYSSTVTVADGYLSFLNNYDSQIYTVGKGPSSLTVDAPMTTNTFGSSVVIRGTVTDISAGTTQAEQAARFPHGVPAVSDTSMSAWMEYVYQQQPKPTNVTGVPVTLSVVDANGNYRTIGTATSDASGMFTFTWKPDITGDYKVVASFAGSESYYPSSAETSFTVDKAAATPAPLSTQAPSMADLYFVPGIIGVIVAIAIVGAVLLLALRKKP